MKPYLELDKYILFSDLHYWHNNILEYEPIRKRKKYQKILTNFLNIIPNKTHKQILNLWDFFFNLTDDKYQQNKETIDKWRNEFKNMILVLWNHDTNKPVKFNKLNFDNNWNILNKEDSNAIVLKLFNCKAFYIDEDNEIIKIFTHYPLWFLKANWQTYWFFYNIETFLFDYIKIKNKRVINYHWHTHWKEFITDNNIEYINVCFDYLIN